MGSITIHNIDETLNERLAAEARRHRISKNALIKQLLARELGLPVDGKYADDYREFVGLWTSREHVAFTDAQWDNSTVDQADWR